jgi:hypothetical protein
MAWLMNFLKTMPTRKISLYLNLKYEGLRYNCTEKSARHFATTDVFIHSFIHSSMALQPFVTPWRLLQFRNQYYTGGRTPWTSDQPVAMPLSTHRTTQTHNAHTHIHALSGIRTHDPSVLASEDCSCLRLHGHCDQHH